VVKIGIVLPLQVTKSIALISRRATVVECHKFDYRSTQNIPSVKAIEVLPPIQAGGKSILILRGSANEIIIVTGIDLTTK
jgi:hypothetical protein